MENKTKTKKIKNAGFYTNDLISDSTEKEEKGKRKLDGSGKGTRENKGRGGCSPEEQKEAPPKTKKDNPYFYEYSEDFSDDGNSYKTDKSQTKWNLVGTLAEAYNVWQNAIKSGDQETIERAAKVYWDLKSYITEDFTDDGSYPTVHRLVSLFDQLYRILKTPTLYNELDKLVMSDERSDKSLADRVWNHRLVKEDPIGEQFT